MKINPALRSAPFARPAATFDRPSQSFADFLGDSSAQRLGASAQATSFGARGLFGHAVSDAAAPNQRPSALAGNAPDPAFEADEASPSWPAQFLSEPGAEAVAQTSSGEPIQAPVGGGLADETHAPPAEASLPEPGMFEDGMETEPLSGQEPGLERQAERPVTDQNGPVVVVFGEGETVDVSMGSVELAPGDREKLRRLTARILADHGQQLGDLSVNGEVLTALHGGGGKDDRFRR